MYETLHPDLLIPVDGETVAASRYEPPTAGPSPVVLIVTPYRKDDRITFGTHEPSIRYFCHHGYEVVVADLLGTGASSGDKRPFHRAEGDEMAAIIKWLADREWTTGDVGTYGYSYGAWTQYVAAAVDPEPLKAIVLVAVANSVYESSCTGACSTRSNGRPGPSPCRPSEHSPRAVAMTTGGGPRSGTNAWTPSRTPSRGCFGFSPTRRTIPSGKTVRSPPKRSTSRRWRPAVTGTHTPPRWSISSTESKHRSGWYSDPGDTASRSRDGKPRSTSADRPSRGSIGSSRARRTRRRVTRQSPTGPNATADGHRGRYLARE